MAFLSELRVLDISEGIAAPYCAKLLGDLGADVVKVEAAAGDHSRTLGPFPGDTRDPEQSGSFFYFNTSKRSIVLEDPASLERLVRKYDIIISSETAEQLTARGLGPDVIESWNPAAILTTVTGFGSSGPHSSYASCHLINCAVGGWANFCGTPDREPLQSGGAITETLTGAYAAAATLLAAYGRGVHGGGEHIDVSAQDAVIAGAQLPTLLYEYAGLTPGRYSSVGSGAGACYMLPTSSGYIGLNALTLAQWHLLCSFLDRADIAEDERFQGMSWMRPDERLEEVRAAFRAALADRSAEELFHEAEKWRVPFGLVPSLQDLLDLPPHKERGFYVDLSHPVTGTVATPGLPFNSTVDTPGPTRPPMLGEHTEEVLSALSDAAAGGSTNGTNPLPLEGVRVLDLSMFFAGPTVAQICADAGADVIKVESVQRIDGWRGSGTLVDEDIASWESSPYFNWINRNKRDITLDLTRESGQDIVKKLVADADILIENYTPRVMEKFNLGYEALKEIKPDLIMISLSGFGSDVSWRDYVAFGMSTEQMSGVAHLTGYTGDEPLFTGMTGGDLFSGVMGATVLLSALHHRLHSGEGQHINLSQIEACNSYIGDAMTGFALAGYDPGRIGNAHPVYEPHGIYPCADDGWIAIACKSDAQRQALATLVGEQPIEDWTSSQDKIELMHLLQAEGVPAGAVMTGPDLLADPHLAARGSFLTQDRPGIGVKHYPNQPYQLRRTETPPNVRAPLLGEHVEEVLSELAGLSSDEIVELVIEDVVGTVPLAAR